MTGNGAALDPAIVERLALTTRSSHAGIETVLATCGGIAAASGSSEIVRLMNGRGRMFDPALGVDTWGWTLLFEEDMLQTLSVQCYELHFKGLWSHLQPTQPPNYHRSTIMNPRTRLGIARLSCGAQWRRLLNKHLCQVVTRKFGG